MNECGLKRMILRNDRVWELVFSFEGVWLESLEGVKGYSKRETQTEWKDRKEWTLKSKDDCEMVRHRE